MAEVVVTSTALADLETLIRTHSLPNDTKSRFRLAVRDLARFPELGSPLFGRWSRYRFVLGPWRWLIIVYVYDPDSEVVAMVTVQDGRSSTAATAAN